MKKPYPIIAILFVCLITFSAFINRPDDPIERIVNLLNQITEKEPIEKVHLSFDKPYYATGDTIWFKAYVLVGNDHKLSSLSGVVYTELINENDSVVYRHRLPVFAGVAKGDFVLSEEVKSGAYRIRAYTQWMRNAGDDYFFDKVIHIGSYRPQSISSRISYEYNQDEVTANISYTMAGKPYADKQIEYNIKAVNGEIFKGRGNTDANGLLKVQFKAGRFTGKTSRIVTVLDLGGNKQSIHTFPLKLNYAQTDLQFFPESGSLVKNVSSRVAFKCINREGKGIDVTGTVFDNENNEVVTLNTTHAGMGLFRFMPENNKSYYAQVKYADGSTAKVNLPAVSNSGLVLSVYNTVNPDTLLIRVNANTAIYETGDKHVHLIGQAGGIVYFSSSLLVNQPISNIRIPKNIFPSGITQFTLLTSAGEPLNERIAFIWNNDQMKIDCQSEKKEYSKKEKISLNLKALSKSSAPAVGSFSVSVINETLVPVNDMDESNIYANVLLSSDLKGYIEDPNFYFTDVNSEKQQALDLLMMTQGYRRFVWKDILNQEIRKEPLFKPEKIATTVSGTLTNLSNKPVEGGKITLVSYAAGILMDTVTNTLGKFSFPSMLLKDSVKLTVQGRTATKSDKVILDLDLVPFVKVNQNKNIADIKLNVNDSLKNYLSASKNEFDLLHSKGLLNQTFQLKDVVITSRTRSTDIISSNLNGANHADQVLQGDLQLEACPTLAMCLQGRLAGVVFVEGIAYLSRNLGTLPNNPLPMLLVVNGRQILSSDLEYSGVFDQGSINPADIYSIEVLKSDSYINVYGAAGRGGVLIINLKPGAFSNNRKAYGVITYQHKGFYKARDFYAPKYDGSASAKLTAPRTTVYWNPSVVTGKDGIAKFEFYNENEGKYRVLVEGVNGEGQLGRQVYWYTVK